MTPPKSVWIIWHAQECGGYPSSVLLNQASVRNVLSICVRNDHACRVVRYDRAKEEKK